MSDKTKLGYVFLHAGDVLSRAEDALTRISESRAERREEFIQNMMAPQKGLLFTRRARTREEALEVIDGDTWLRHEMWYLTDSFVSPKQEALKKLVNVAHALLGGGDATMQITIEAADWLYPDGV